MKLQKILWDMDGCKARLLTPVVAYLNTVFPDLNWTEDDVTMWNFSKDPQISSVAFEFMRTPGFFRNLQPYDGSLKAYQEVVQIGHEVVICTTPLSGEHEKQCIQEKLEWVEHYLGSQAVKTVQFSFDKTQIEADVIIDDQPHLTLGKTDIKFRNWVIVDQPYNRNLPEMDHHPFARIFNDWSNWKEVFFKLDLV